MNQHNLWYAILLLNLCILFLSKLITAGLLELNATANLSASWINYPPDSSVYFLESSFSPILYSGLSNGSRFLCGFYSTSSNEIADYVFGILIFNNRFVTNEIYKPKLVWSANRDHPVKINATIEFTISGDLILKDSDDTWVWSTNTDAKKITGLALTKTGNLLLHDKNNKIVWQSFDHPTDTLLPKQKMSSGQSLWSSTSEENFSQGLFSFDYEKGTLSANIQSNPPLNYFQDYYWGDDAFGNQKYFNNENYSSVSYKETLASATTQFMRLDFDGHLKIYEWSRSGWNVASDVFSEVISECGYPLVCGKYGVCSSGQQCTCPSAFTPVNSRHPNLGCSSSKPINCSNFRSHTLLELKNTSYFKLDQSYESSKENVELEDCKNSCLKNCSCKAAFFENYIDDTSGRPYSNYNRCFLVNEVYSMNNIEDSGNVLVFLKVEESHRKKSDHVPLQVGLSIGVTLGAVSLFVFLFLLLRKNNEIEEFDELSFNQVPWMPTRFSYDDLKAITNNFLNKLGQGGFGSVFEGTLNDGTKVAVKRLDGVREIKKSFLAEVETIGSIHHVNLVRLIGFCAEKSHGLLVYEYMPKGSLDKWIFQANKELSLKWERRKKIILDIAKGLAYLHEECRCKIFHLDIKPQNILLDENLNAKVSDFGLAKLIDKDQSRVMTTLRGTPGYLAPEWLSSIITEKVDVYSFGVVVLEILCGRRNIDHSQPEEEMHLLALFKTKAEECSLEDIVDKHEDMKLHAVEVIEMMKVAVWCLQSDFTTRPSMSVVVKVLEGSADVIDNLDHNFANFIVSRTSIAPADYLQNEIRDATPVLPVSLSGPR